MKKVIFLTDNFPPEVNAPATRTFEHLDVWKKDKNIKFTIITCFPNYPHGIVYEGYKNKFYEKVECEGYTLIRVWSYMAPNKGFFKRIIDQLSYAISAFIVGFFVKSDLIIATSPQFFTAVSGYFLALFKRKPWIMEVRDLWPETIAAVNTLKRESILFKLLEFIELRLYKSSNRIIVVTDTFKKVLVDRGVLSKKIFIHKNGVDLNKFYPIKKNYNLLKKIKLDNNKIIFGYVGTLGMTHGLSFIISCMTQIKKKLPNAHFLFIGEGAEKNNLISQAKDLNLDNVSFLPIVPKNEIVNYLSIIDIALVNLKKEKTFETVIPSKIFESAAMGKPILLGLLGETKLMIEHYNAGKTFEPENSEEFIHSCIHIVMKKNYMRYKEGALKLSRDFNRKKIAEELLNTIKSI